MGFSDSFSRCGGERRLKPSARKDELFTNKVKLHGRITSADGVEFDLARPADIEYVTAPETAAELCQYIHCPQWVSVAAPDFSSRVAPLKAVMEEAYSFAGKSTRRSLKNIRLSQLSWGPACNNLVTELQEPLQQAATLAHRKEKHALCMYIDAPEDRWARAMAQRTPDQLS